MWDTGLVYGNNVIFCTVIIPFEQYSLKNHIHSKNVVGWQDDSQPNGLTSSWLFRMVV